MVMDDMDLIHLAKNAVHWWAPVSTIIKLLVL
jgi:hypothetical protein